MLPYSWSMRPEPMGDKVRAGCPWRNLQQTLDGLTRNGLTVAVYEEGLC